MNNSVDEIIKPDIFENVYDVTMTVTGKRYRDIIEYFLNWNYPHWSGLTCDSNTTVSYRIQIIFNNTLIQETIMLFDLQVRRI